MRTRAVRNTKMPTIDKLNDDDGLTLLDQKRALEDELWFWAVAENYAKGRLKGLQSREEVIAKYYTQYPDMRAYVDAVPENISTLVGKAPVGYIDAAQGRIIGD